MILRLLIKVPERMTCRDYVYRIHMSTYLTGQPSSFDKRTQDVLLVSAFNDVPDIVYEILT